MRALEVRVAKKYSRLSRNSNWVFYLCVHQIFLDSYANFVFLVENDEMNAHHKRYYDASNDQPGTWSPTQAITLDLALKHETIAQYGTNVQKYRCFLRKCEVAALLSIYYSHREYYTKETH